MSSFRFMPMLAVVCVLLALHLGDALSGFFMQGFLLFLLGLVAPGGFSSRSGRCARSLLRGHDG